MKKLVFAAITLMVLAGSTFTISSLSNTTVMTAVVKPVIKPADLPVPVCPANDPNGCGIYN